MNREVFQSNKIVAVSMTAVVFIGVTIAYLKAGMPIWIFAIAFVFGLLLIIPAFTTKLIIEDGMLRYKKIFGGEEVELENVSQIVIREVETIVDSNQHSSFQESSSGIQAGGLMIGNQQQTNQERQVKKFIYILDDVGRTMFSIPANIVGFTQRTRFKEAIHLVNPNIDVF